MKKAIRNWKLKIWAAREKRKESPYTYPPDTIDGVIERIDKCNAEIEVINQQLRANRN